MIWTDDLIAIEPSFYLSDFNPEQDGIRLDELAIALASCSTATREHVLRWVNSELRRKLSIELSRVDNPSLEDQIRAHTRVVALYFWEVVYRRYPEEYDRFSKSQQFNLHRLYPLQRYHSCTVLDAGCGTGKLVEHLWRVAAKVYAMDPVTPMLDVTRKKFDKCANVTTFVGRFNAIPLPDESVDCIVSNLAFQPNENRGGDTGLRSLQRVLRPGGEIRMIVGNWVAQDFLLNRGFRESFLPGALEYSVPEDPSPVLRALYELAAVGAPLWREFSFGRAQEHRYLFASRRWRYRWTMQNLLALLSGRSLEQLFHKKSLFAPLGIPVYSWTKS